MAYFVLPADSSTTRLWNPILEEYGYERGMDELTFDYEVDGRPASKLTEDAAKALADATAGEFYPHDYGDDSESDDSDGADTAESDETESDDATADDDEADAADDSERAVEMDAADTAADSDGGDTADETDDEA